MRRTYEQSPAAVKKCHDEEYPTIAARAKFDGAELHWDDETGLRSDDVRGRSFAPRGETPVIRINSKREGLSVISNLTDKGQMRCKMFLGTINADILIDFMGRLVKSAAKKVFLILDNLRVHHCKPVKQWLAEHAAQIEVFYLPSYSPELNPDEMANARHQASGHGASAGPYQAATRQGDGQAFAQRAETAWADSQIF